MTPTWKKRLALSYVVFFVALILFGLWWACGLMPLFALAVVVAVVLFFWSLAALTGYP